MTEYELRAAIRIKAKLDRLEGRLEDLEETGGLRSGLSSGSPGGKAQDAGQIAAELREETAQLRKKLDVEQEIIRRALEKVDFDELERKLMALRYVECKPWRYICGVLGYADRQTYRIHSAAIKKMAVDGSP